MGLKDLNKIPLGSKDLGSLGLGMLSGHQAEDIALHIQKLMQMKKSVTMAEMKRVAESRMIATRGYHGNAKQEMQKMLKFAQGEQLKLKVEIRVTTKMKKWADSKRSFPTQIYTKTVIMELGLVSLVKPVTCCLILHRQSCITTIKKLMKMNKKIKSHTQKKMMTLKKIKSITMEKNLADIRRITGQT